MNDPAYFLSPRYYSVAFCDCLSSDDPQRGSKKEDAENRANDQRSWSRRFEELLSNAGQHAWRLYFQRKRGRNQDPGSDC